MRPWTPFLLIALVGMLAPLTAGSHTTRTAIEIDMGESFDLLRGAGEVVEVTARPAGILQIRPAGRRVEVECVRVGKTDVTLKYRADGDVHTLIIAVTCVEKER